MLEKAGVTLEPGLTESEILNAEERYSFKFPPDLRAFLSFALPIGDSWPNWRECDDADLWGRLKWPLDGICFDIEHSNFWHKEWGPKPNSLQASFEIAKQRIRAAPTLIPIFVHRYLPTRPLISGNPVLSVYQTDIIYYGSDLWTYFRNEFSKSREESEANPERIGEYVEFWSDLICGNC